MHRSSYYALGCGAIAGVAALLESHLPPASRPFIFIVVVLGVFGLIGFGIASLLAISRSSDENITPERSERTVGRLRVTSGRLRIGDADWPLPSTEITDVPNGLYEVRCEFWRHPKSRQETPAVLMIDFGINGRVSTTQNLEFSIESGIAAVADPRDEVDLPATMHKVRQKEVRRDLDRAMAACQRGTPILGELLDPGGQPWMFFVQSGLGDSCYEAEIHRVDGRAHSIRCRFL